MADPRKADTRHRWTRAEAQAAHALGMESRRARAVSLKDPQALAEESTIRIVTLTRAVERELPKLQGRDRLEAVKLCLTGDGMVLDRTRGKPRPEREASNAPDDYRKVAADNRKRLDEMVRAGVKSELLTPQDLVSDALDNERDRVSPQDLDTLTAAE